MNTNNIKSNPLLAQVYEASFAMDEINLYLDTHPTDLEALSYYHYVSNLRRQAINSYETQYGPLMIDGVNSNDYWNWIDDKWPWEGEFN